jgi:hypothetical protein
LSVIVTEKSLSCFATEKMTTRKYGMTLQASVFITKMLEDLASLFVVQHEN